MHDYNIHLSIDNCFASKRWTEPAEWMKIVGSLGLKYVEASADTECDPLYNGTEYIERWLYKTAEASEINGVKISSLYSGHGTYSTIGLAHTDPDVKRRFINRWMKPMIKLSGSLGTSLGFFCHAFPEGILAEPENYRKEVSKLIDVFCELTCYSAEHGCKTLSVEQMYSPNQVPWTIPQSEHIMEEVYRRTGIPIYITIDVGHMCGQRNYLKHESVLTGYEDINRFPYMFCESSDSDPYNWIKSLGGYSPVIHLQQTSGSSSSHLPFTAENNLSGIIRPERVLDSLRVFYEGYGSGTGNHLPAVKDIYLTLELFFSNAEKSNEIIRKIRESVEYWQGNPSRLMLK